MNVGYGAVFPFGSARAGAEPSVRQSSWMFAVRITLA